MLSTLMLDPETSPSTLKRKGQREGPPRKARRLKAPQREMLMQYQLSVGSGGDDYELTESIKGLPAQVKVLPDKEAWSFWYKAGFLARFATLAGIDVIWQEMHFGRKGNWDSFDELQRIYKPKASDFYVPEGMDQWREDAHFGFQRMCGPNHSLIELCTSIPKKLPVTEKMLKPFIEEMTIQQAIKKKRLFIVDLKLMKSLNNNFQCKDPEVVALCAPIGLFFYETVSEKLKPVAIQLYQDPGKDNPIFLPSDPDNLWTWVKMWFNNADANYHQAVVHLGFTHLLMEGPAVVTHRYLHDDHPIFKLLLPHFYHLMAINDLARGHLINEGGFVDSLMNMGTQGAFTLIGERLKEWRLDVDGTLPEDLKRRGLDDTNVLPAYHYRNDALKLYHVIKKYVDSYVKICYDTADKLKNDDAIQNWAQALVKPRAKEHGGCGFLGVPGNGRLDNADQLVTIVTSFIVTSSLVHAATNFPQYDEYAFPPNYPALLKGDPPTTKADVKEDKMLKAVANKLQTYDTMVIMRLLSQKADHGLGDFEVDVHFDNKGPFNQFRQDLEALEQEIIEANKTRRQPYTHLLPSKVPNTIEI